MKKDEEYVEQFLGIFNLGILCYEPCGNSTFPDFSTSKGIAIEVRRLNKHLWVDGKIDPIEEPNHNSLVKIVRDELKSLKFESPKSIGVSIQFSRPLNLKKSSKNKLKKELKRRLLSATKNRQFNHRISFFDGISMTLFEGNGRSKQAFELVGIHDNDQGGNITKARYDALKLIVNDKSKKIKPLKSYYNEFWLVLVDHIFSRVDKYSIIDLHHLPPIESSFNRIIILNRRDLTKWQDLLPWQ